MAVLDYEEQLAVAAGNGKLAAQRLLYQNNIRYLTAVCSRYVTNAEDVRDILQDSFLKIFSSLPSFQYRGDGSLRAWMKRVVVNESLKFLRRTDRLEFTGLSDLCHDIPSEEPDTDSLQPSEIFELVTGLPDGYRTIFNLYVIEGKSHREIASMLNIKESTSASQLHRAKALLANRIREYQTQSNR